MANLFIDLDTGGAAADVSAQGKTKTFNVAGSFSGFLSIEANCGGEWREVKRFTSPGNATLDGAFKELRANTGNVSGTVDRITVSADDTGAKFAELPVNGAAVDVSDLGTFNTVVIGGDALNGLLKVLISDDGVDWTDWKAYQSATVDSDEVVTQFMKATYDGSGTPEVCIGAINAESDASAPITNYVFRPGATGEFAEGQNVYLTEDDIIAALESTKNNGRRVVEFDSRFSPDVNVVLDSRPVCRISKVWDLDNCTVTAWNGKGGPSGNFLALDSTIIEFVDGGVFQNMTHIDAIELYFVNSNTVEVPIPLPALRYFGGGSDGAQLLWDGDFIGFDITDPAATPMFEIQSSPGGGPELAILAMNGSFNCRFGSSFLLNRFGPPARPLINIEADQQFNLIIGAGVLIPETVEGDGIFVIDTAGGAAINNNNNEIAQSGFTGTFLFNSFACFQSPRMSVDEILNDGGVPTALAKYSTALLIDMSTAATPQAVEMIAAGPRKGETSIIKDKTGGCAVGNEINISPKAGDTIDGGAGPLVLDSAFASVTLVNDGFNNWSVIS